MTMTHARHWSAEDIARALELREAGRTRAQIGTALGRTHKAVESMFKRYRLLSGSAAIDGRKQCALPSCDVQFVQQPGESDRDFARRLYCGPACREQARRERMLTGMRKTAAYAMTPSDFARWVQTAKPGDSVVYGVAWSAHELGPVAATAFSYTDQLQPVDGKPRSGMGLVALTQRLVEGGFEYVATRVAGVRRAA